jgi:hypothetical protein
MKSEDSKLSVFGLFRDDSEVTRAVDGLERAGFPKDDISALVPDLASTRTFAHEKHTKAPEGAMLGAIIGVVVGGVLGILFNQGAIPDFTALIATDPVVAALAGAGAVGIAGAIIGGLIGMGMPEYEAKRYDAYAKKGGALVSVHVKDRDQARRAKSLLDGYGGHDIANVHEQKTFDDSTTRH